MLGPYSVQYIVESVISYNMTSACTKCRAQSLASVRRVVPFSVSNPGPSMVLVAPHTQFSSWSSIQRVDHRDTRVLADKKMYKGDNEYGCGTSLLPSDLVATYFVTCGVTSSGHASLAISKQHFILRRRRR